ncbi:MAG: DNA gyrase subunit A, partial [Clostridia bacterium]|nr:DNA gyrase subunit A [Clostridia bacterium]
TQLQDTCAVNMLALVKGEPKTLNLKQVLENYVEFQEEVVLRRTKFELAKAKAEEHIYEGYKIALDNIDEIISIIRGSASTPEAKEKLKETFCLSDEQAQAIVEMTLGRLSGLERQKIEERLLKLQETIKELNEIITNEGKLKSLIKDELSEIKRRFADDRRTEIIDSEEEIDIEDLIERHECVITLTNSGYIKRIPADTYSAQRRGGKGLIAMHTKEEDFIEKVLVANSHDYLLMFTDSGKIFVRKVYRIPEASRTAKGSNIINLIEIEKGERVTAMVTLSEFIHGEYLTMVTEKGVIKRTDIAEYEYQRKGGKIAINLDEGDRLIFVGHTDGTNHILIATKNGYGARFDENKVNVVGRTARGVRGIDLRAGDIVCGAVIVDNDKQLLTITENGYGKKSFFDEFEPRNRGIMGVIAHNISEKTGKLAAVACVDDNKDVMVITNEGVIIRTATDVIPTYKRSTTGVKIMRLDDGAIVANTTLVDKEDDEENEAVLDGIENAQEINEAVEASEQVTENNEKTDTPPAENE